MGGQACRRGEACRRKGVGNDYADRNRVEDGLGISVNLFHLDFLASEFRLNVNLETTLTVLANGCYRWLGKRLRGYDKAAPKQLDRLFVATQGFIRMTPDELIVRCERRSHSPILRGVERHASRRYTHACPIASRCMSFCVISSLAALFPRLCPSFADEGDRDVRRSTPLPVGIAHPTFVGFGPRRRETHLAMSVNIQHMRDNHVTGGGRSTSPTGFRCAGTIALRLTGHDPNPRHEQLNRSGHKAPRSAIKIDRTSGSMDRKLLHFRC